MFFLTYGPEGRPVSSLSEIAVPENSTFLKITARFLTAQERDLGRVRMLSAANLLRMTFGIPAAREACLFWRSDEGRSENRWVSDPAYASFFDTQALNLFGDPPIEEAKIRRIPDEAHILIDKALSQRFPEEAFILLWVAFEAIISAFPGNQTNGEKRKRYFKGTLMSNDANEEVRMLHRVRGDLFKEGRADLPELSLAIQSLYCAIQLSILEDCPQRAAFLRGYEAQITQRRNERSVAPN
ncbi:hypothetical protein [Jannaschia ovalis]|uniref:ApeA N-terminal domain-containing protein n=1 Tax=Jannaschia ovalis TaxID=3038773 RepID=A0ABY8LDR5_9RHOB|nr:hypothetical protein [Jannaschia sp. GRR-S6-38]WGH78215.1 hypothetical protein P8627_14445 [Jannaschia sp. GRR-S6-38]